MVPFDFFFLLLVDKVSKMAQNHWSRVRSSERQWARLGGKGGGKLSGRGRDNEVVSGAGRAGGYGTGDTGNTRDRHSAVTGHYRESLRGPLVVLSAVAGCCGP